MTNSIQLFGHDLLSTVIDEGTSVQDFKLENCEDMSSSDNYSNVFFTYNSV